MPPWVVFTAAAAALFGGVVWISSTTAGALAPKDVQRESRAFLALVGPVLAGALVVAFLVGWALQEPDPADEWVAVEVRALATAVGFVVLRAVLRAVRSLCVSQASMPVATIGLWRCRAVVSRAFSRLATGDVLAAALAHEAAHGRARDPLRIWFARLAADLQWPLPGARRRLRRWMLSLELARDDEALAAGASPVALAEAIIIAATLCHADDTAPSAAMVGDGDALALRVRRLLGQAPPSPVHRRRQPSWCFWPACVVTIAGAVWLGAAYGDALLGLLPGICR